MDSELRYKPTKFEIGKGVAWNELDNIMNENQSHLEQIDQLAKGRGELVGRYIQEQIADGYAFYQIIKENKRTCVIRVCRYLGDDWVISYWGEQATIDKAYALKSVNGRDRMRELFSNRN